MLRGRISARTVELQRQLSLHFGLGPEDLAELGLGSAVDAHPDATVAGAVVYAHLERVHAAGRFEAFAVELARAHRLSTMGLVGVLAQHQPTGAAAFESYRRHQHLTNGLASADLVVAGARATWVETRPGPDRLGARLATELSVMVVVQIVRTLLGEPIRPEWVELPRAELDPAPYQAFLGAELRLGAAEGRIVFPAELLERPLPGADPEAARQLAALLEQRHGTAARLPPIVVRVREVVLPRLASGAPSLAEVARALRTSTRTLQRELQACGLGYAAVVDALRRDVALGRLADPSTSVAEVAYLVGYSEPRAFHRAFRRWTGEAPSAYRAGADAPS